MPTGIKDMGSRHWWKLIGAILILMAAIAGFLFYMNLPAGNGERMIELSVKGGWGPQKVITELYRERVIKSRSAFWAYLKLRGKTGSIKKGIYQINDGMTINGIIDLLVSGKTKVISITIPEGFNNRQIGEAMARKGLFDSQDEFLRVAASREVLKKFAIPGKDTEGYLFPDTYYFPVGYDKVKIIEHMVQQFMSETGALENFPRDPLERHRAVILASIVEREAKLKEERSPIAAVFLKRLGMNYPLESCATIQYLFDKPKKRIYFRDLEIESPYNTYINKGLPPDPSRAPDLILSGPH